MTVDLGEHHRPGHRARRPDRRQPPAGLVRRPRALPRHDADRRRPAHRAGRRRRRAPRRHGGRAGRGRPHLAPGLREPAGLGVRRARRLAPGGPRGSRGPGRLRCRPPARSGWTSRPTCRSSPPVPRAPCCWASRTPPSRSRWPSTCRRPRTPARSPWTGRSCPRRSRPGDRPPQLGLALRGLQLPGAAAPRDVVVDAAELDDLGDALLDLVLGLLHAATDALPATDPARGLAGLLGLVGRRRGRRSSRSSTSSTSGPGALAAWWAGCLTGAARAAWLGHLATLLGGAVATVDGVAGGPGPGRRRHRRRRGADRAR